MVTLGTTLSAKITRVILFLTVLNDLKNVKEHYWQKRFVPWGRTLTTNYNYLGDYLKVKVFDYEDEKDLEEEINNFLENNNIEVIDIKYQVAVSVFSEEQVFCFSAMIIYS